ncbi:uncharacterized protein LOC121726382 isoform X1 [Aricia agestis]|uniref:uncharacterized protein LOC121726382 isoform X1 n=1 Tax=Aricia agestis TaxID=91739 RepID=UPI001C204A38|nr:uncharacterized protein LOC121726382 isoform X1 [Aricia agestis]
MYSSWKLRELKEELNKRGAKVTGKKADLVKRLEFYDQNLQCGNQSPQSSQHGQNMDVPAAETFRDINSSVVLPKITKQHIQSYFDRFNKNIGDAIKLYESRYLYVLRSSQQGQDTFLKGISIVFIYAHHI